MSAELDNAKLVLAELSALHEEGWCACQSSTLPARVQETLESLTAALSSPPADDVREALAREIYRRLYPGDINTPDSMRSAESDAKERDRAYKTWDRGREGYAPGAICRRLADAILARFEVRLRGTETNTTEVGS